VLKYAVGVIITKSHPDFKYLFLREEAMTKQELAQRVNTYLSWAQKNLHENRTYKTILWIKRALALLLSFTQEKEITCPLCSNTLTEVKSVYFCDNCDSFNLNGG
jgi:hypothetical protein